MQYSIPCQHTTGEVQDWDQAVNDFHALSVAEITHLLEVARQSDTKTINSIHVRLCQGIQGNMCPREIEGKVAEAENLIDRMYMDFIHDPEQDVNSVAQQLHNTMQVQ